MAAVNDLQSKIMNLRAPYCDGISTPFCYPGTTLREDIGDIAKIVVQQQFNNIGTHSYNDPGEGGFQTTHKMEKEYLLTAVLGRGVLIMDNEHQELEVVASPKEHQIITTNPDEILKQKEVKIKKKEVSLLPESLWVY
mgnify:CR=1 FL=1